MDADLDEDFEPALTQEPTAQNKEFDESQMGPRHDGPDFGDEETGSGSGSFEELGLEGEPVSLVKPFEHLPDLPADIEEAFDQFKLAILHYKREDWSDFSREEMLLTLDALKALVDAPATDEIAV